MRTLTLGKRYALPHGTGVLVGMEVPDPLKPGHMMTLKEGPMKGTIYTRFIFKLDEGHTWAVKGMEHYAAWNDDIKRIPK